jgi:hypothetical protein
MSNRSLTAPLVRRAGAGDKKLGARPLALRGETFSIDALSAIPKYWGEGSVA